MRKQKRNAGHNKKTQEKNIAEKIHHSILNFCRDKFPAHEILEIFENYTIEDITLEVSDIFQKAQKIYKILSRGNKDVCF